MMTEVRARGSIEGLLLISIPTVVGGYFVYFVFGFQFLIENGPFLAAGLILIVFLRSSSWWPAAFLMVQVPFQGLLVQKFGVMANFLTLCAALAFLSRYPPAALPRLLLGTRVQRLAALLALGVSVPTLWSDPGLTNSIAMLQKFTLLAILAAIAVAFRNGEQVPKIAVIIVISAAVMYVLSTIEFYFGADVFPGFKGNAGLLATLSQNVELSELEIRLGYTEISGRFGPNRFAFLSILPMSLSMGLLLTSTRSRSRFVWAVAIAVFGFGLFISGTRADAFGWFVAFAVILTVLPNWRLRARLMTVIVLVVGLGMLILQSLPTGVTLYDRFASKQVSESLYSASGIAIDVGRKRMWELGLDLFKENPITGVGLGRFEEEVAYRLPQSPVRDIHSGYLLLLAESGLLGTVPYAVLLLYAVTVLRRSTSSGSRLRIWGTVFFAANLGMLASTVFNSYNFDRYFWVPIAFVVMIEVMGQQGRLSAIPKAIRPSGIPRPSIGDIPAAGR